MKTTYFLTLAILGIVTLANGIGRIHVNDMLDYSIYLPENWKHKAASDSQDFFYDSSLVYDGNVSLVRHTMDTVFHTPAEWARAFFIAYKMYVDYHPYGVVLFYDSSQSAKLDGQWAPEMYIRFYDDTANYAWDEYVRFTAVTGYGYELYAIGDTSDMKANVGLYGAIIQSIEFQRATGLHESRHYGLAGYLKIQQDMHSYCAWRYLTPLGRTVNWNHPARLPAGVYVHRGIHSIAK
jgi:hypothetical protein